jgi:hypothetical protein
MNLIIIAVITAIAMAFSSFAKKEMQKVRRTRVVCTDIITDKKVEREIAHTGFITPFNRDLFIEHAKRRFESEGMIPKRMTII